MAAALVATLRVGAESLTAAIFNGTLIDVCGSTNIHSYVLLRLPESLGKDARLIRTNTVQPVLGRFIACVTGALVAANHVDTLAVLAQPVTQLTFIDICGRRQKLFT